MTRRLLPVVSETDSGIWDRFADPGGFATALVHPFLPEAATKNRLKFRESLALGYLTAALERSRYSVTTINAELECLPPEAVVERLLEVPDLGLLGISAKSQRTYRAAKTIASLLKAARPDVHVTVGGVFPSAAADEVLRDAPAIDTVVRGEGEYAITELAWRVAMQRDLSSMPGITYRSSGEPVATENRPRIRDLDAIPIPARRDLELILDRGETGGFSAYLVASRGCYASCSFCSIHQIYGDHNVVRRSPRSIVHEMATVKQKYGIRRFSFVDDLFIMPSKRGYQWVHDFCDEIEAAGLDVSFYAEMRADTIEPDLVQRLIEAGLHRLFIGVESGVDSVLKRWDKGTTVRDNDSALQNLKQIGLPPHAINFGYIMFDPEMTLEELKEQFQWIRSSGHCKVQHLQNKMNIYWGTPQYDKMIQMGRVDDSPLGGRWQYEFDDWRVGEVEKTVRWFHERYERESLEPLLRGREAFTTLVHDDTCTVEIPHWLFDLLTQASKLMDGAERGVYYEVFERSFAQVDDGHRCSTRFLEDMWLALQPRIAAAQMGGQLLETFATTLANIEVARSAEEFKRPGTAMLDDKGRRAQVRLSDDFGGFRAVVGVKGHDRYDHACEVVTFR